MSLDEALERLGIDAETEHKVARRAYLRLLKKHKPEQDPEGFQRLRTAWERVDAHLKLQNRVSTPVAAFPPRPPDPPRKPTSAPSHADVATDVQVPPLQTVAREADPWSRLFAVRESGDAREELAALGPLIANPRDASELHAAAVLALCWRLFEEGDVFFAGEAFLLFDELIACKGGPLRSLEEHERLQEVYLREMRSVRGLLPPAVVSPLARLLSERSDDLGAVFDAMDAFSSNEKKAAQRARDLMMVPAPQITARIEDGWADLPRTELEVAQVVPGAVGAELDQSANIVALITTAMAGAALTFLGSLAFS